MSHSAHSFASQLWLAGEPVYRRILEHPFMQELVRGELGSERFAFYLIQDYLFLQVAAKAFNIAASNAHNDEWILAFNQCSTDVLRTERSLHEDFFKELGISPKQVASTPMAPTNEAYCNYLLATAHEGSFTACLATLLPSFWIYESLGKDIRALKPKSPLFQRWADFYGGEDYDDMMETVVELVNQVGDDISPEERDEMRRIFVHTCRYEWMFWQMSYHLEGWPFDR